MYTFITPRNLKIRLGVPKAFRKLQKIEAGEGNSKIEFQFFFSVMVRSSMSFVPQKFGLLRLDLDFF